MPNYYIYSDRAPCSSLTAFPLPINTVYCVLMGDLKTFGYHFNFQIQISFIIPIEQFCECTFFPAHVVDVSTCVKAARPLFYLPSPVCASSWLAVRAQAEVLQADQDNMPTLHLRTLP